jgi:hypothetical protein
MTEQREFIFHNSVPVPEEQLEECRNRAESQKDKILTIFRSNPKQMFTPYQIQDIYQMVYNEPILITSVRRSITDLTNEGTGKLIKTYFVADQVKEKYHVNNNRWRFNETYSPLLNKK